MLQGRETNREPDCLTPDEDSKPLPLTTVELQKAGSRLLHLTPKRVLDVINFSLHFPCQPTSISAQVAESLYQRGLISYPRTETDQFDPSFNFKELIEKQLPDTSWGDYCQRLLNSNEFEKPRNGSKNDKAHPPIHPTGHANGLTGDDKKVSDSEGWKG
jgi:DNA topoisomerase III